MQRRAMARIGNPRIPLVKEKAVIILYREMTAFDVGEAVDLSERTVFRIVHDAGVKKRGGWTGPQPSAPPLERCGPGVVALGKSPLAIAESALAEAERALAEGRANDAVALAKAGGAVGELAELVKLLRERDGAPIHVDSRGLGEV